MENEEGSFDVEEWAEEGMKDAEGKLDDDFEPAPAEEEEAPKEKEQEPEQETKEEQQPESTIAALLKSDSEQQRVPVEDHIKLRKRAQAAEAEAEELKRRLAEKQTQTEGEDSGEPLAELEDDDLVRAGDVRQAIKKEVGKAVSKVTQDIESEKATQNAQAMAEKAIKSEEAFRKDTPDYDKVTSAANNLGIITEADRQEMFKSDNPAKKYYEIAKSKITNIQKNLDITPTTTTKEAPKTEEETGEEEGEEELTDEKILEELYGQ